MTIEDIYEYNKNGSYLLVANKCIYDVSEFKNIHPAGDKCIINKLYKDSSIDYKFHSKKAKKIWDQYKIGYVINKNDSISYKIWLYLFA